MQVTVQRTQDFMRVLQGDVVVVPMAIGVFMIGVWLVRSGRMHDVAAQRAFFARLALYAIPTGLARSEEHSSELQSLMRISYAVFCLKKNKQPNTPPSIT